MRIAAMSIRYHNSFESNFPTMQFRYNELRILMTRNLNRSGVITVRLNVN